MKSPFLSQNIRKNSKNKFKKADFITDVTQTKENQKFAKMEYDPINSADPFGMQSLMDNSDLIIQKMDFEYNGCDDYNAVKDLHDNILEDDLIEREETFGEFINKIEGNTSKQRNELLPSDKIMEEYLDNYEFVKF